MRGLLALLFALLLSACSAGSAPRDAEVVIPAGSSLTAAADILETAGGIESASSFLTYAKLSGGDEPIKPGTYRIEKGTSGEAVLRMLQDGKTVQHYVTVPEGLPSIMVWDRLMANDDLTGKIPVPAEGSILPETYAYQKGETRAAVVARMQEAMDKAWADLWPKRNARAFPKDRNEAITLASIIEKETPVADELTTVSAVYTNRLELGMMLQADPTIIYPITKGKALGRRIRKSEIADVNDYNTYAMAGLPKGPIANPSRAAIAAALNPNDSKALYFVADGKGGHIFAGTLAEHNANVKKWYAIRRARGEM
ncbi:MAG: endolytic transglycosylase MltG [Sphingomonadales bacterium]|nr:endolytic transglycosylase MltG [Sphingomonadales bacterium]